MKQVVKMGGGANGPGSCPTDGSTIGGVGPSGSITIVAYKLEPIQ
jgi:hypothetical protein